ncbi:small-conductance mechanosensitive channel [Burkholderiales bacterium JOSHI_001]|nr:small-conductance mechanosensitive channel [Burkholderiales bacterium JOSHI_001]
MLAPLLAPTALAETGVLLLCLALAGGLVFAMRRRVGNAAQSVWLGHRGYDGVLFPLLALLAALVARWALAGHLPIAVFKLAVPILASLAAVRVVGQVMHQAFPKSGLARAFERSLSWVVWGVLVLWLTGLLPQLLQMLDEVHWKLAGTDVSLRSLIEGALSALVVMLLMLWLSASIEARLLHADGMDVDLSVRKIAANGTRALLLLVGLLLALSAAGIPLAALSVMGGAVGVGLGFGLQKLAANYVSGFVILAERSMRIGDVVKVDGFEGRISDITTRYTVIRAVNGRESIVPNEMLITQRVESSSFADPKVAQTTVVQVAYGTDLSALLPQLEARIATVERVLADPAPAAQLSNFAADGLELTLVYWIADPGNGTGNVRSQVNLVVLAALSAAGVEIPFPQRVLHRAPRPATD